MKIKKLLSVLLPLCLFSVLLVQGQNIQLTFTGMDNDIPVQLESINVYNLSRDIGPVVLLPGATLTLDKSLTLVPSGGFSMELISNHPVRDIGHIRVYIPKLDKVTISASDMLGRHQNLFSGFLDAGYHSFYLTPGSENLIVLGATWRSSYTSLKIISTTAIEGTMPAISYKGLSENQLAASGSGNAILPFSDGDQLYFEGIADGQLYVLDLSPTESQNLQLKKKPVKPTPPPPPVSSTACPGTPTVTYAGKTYNTVQIGNQCWLKENLDVGVKVNSTYIAETSHQETSNNGIIEKYCYDNQSNNCSTFGGLYNWCEVVQYQNGASDYALWNPAPTGHVQGICPSGWHIPSEDEWTILTNEIGGIVGAGDKLKSTSTHPKKFWTGGVNNTTNSTGFTALPAGGRTYAGNFFDKHMRASFWSSTAIYSEDYLWAPQPALIFPRTHHLLYNSEDMLPPGGSTSTFAYSVRCIKD